VTDATRLDDRQSRSGAHTDVLLRARGLTKRFGDFVAVDGIDVEVRRGEAFGFLGPNGAGKSSTMRMIGCVSPVTAGELTIFGLDPRRDGPEIRAQLGVVPQRDTLDEELTVQENLWVYGRYFGLSRAEVKRRAAELLEFAQLSERATDKVEPLSGGMKRRLTIARSPPRELIDAYSTREVLELRFDVAEHDAEIGDRLEGIGDRVEVLPDRILVYASDGDAALSATTARGFRPVSALVRRSTLEDVFLHLTGRSLID
jgi:ABC-type transport system involved in cytochrome c biogenesis ATPase subunit